MARTDSPSRNRTTANPDFLEFVHDQLAEIRDVRATFVRHNIRLVAWIATRFQGRGLDLSDLVQEGSLGLLWSINRFDPAYGTKLSTFATYAIRLGVYRALALGGRMIRLPSHRASDALSISKTSRELEEELARAPSVEEIALDLEMDPKNVEELLAAMRPVASLDAPVRGTDTLFSARIVDTARATPWEITEANERAERLERLLERLPKRERTIICMRYGIGYEDSHSFEQIGQSVGFSRERVRQLEYQARARLKSMMENGRSGSSATQHRGLAPGNRAASRKTKDYPIQRAPSAVQTSDRLCAQVCVN